MKKLFRHNVASNKGNSEHKNCPNCGYDSRDNHASEPVEVTDEHIKEATKIVVDEALKVLQPLLDTLQKAQEQFKKEQEGVSSPGQTQNFEQQLANLQAAALQKLQQKEQQVAKRTQKILSQRHT